MRSDTLAYQARVEADGGAVIDISSVEEAYQFLADNPPSPVRWHGAIFVFSLMDERFK
jgi:hypothetical protein